MKQIVHGVVNRLVYSLHPLEKTIALKNVNQKIVIVSKQKVHLALQAV